MKKIFTVMLSLILLLGCLTGCQEKAEAGCTKYTLESMGIGEMTMSGSQARRESGISDLYLKLYDDGTAEMRVSKEIVKMEYADGQIWRTDTPDAKVTYTINGNTITITDGAYTYTFTK